MIKFNLNNIKYISKNILSFALVGLFSQALNAQYCTSNPTSNAYESIQKVTLVGNTVTLNNVTNINPPGVCETYSNHTGLTPVDLSAGRTYTLSVVSTTCTGLTFFTHRTLAWIDYNRNNAFEASEAVIPTAITATSTPFTFNFTFTVPCNISVGNTRMRIVLIEGALANPTNACGTYTWGETEDYTVNLQQATSLQAGFIAPTKSWINAPQRFTNSNQTGYISHAWDADDNGSIEGTSVNFSHTWSSGGTKCVKLSSTNCLGTDAITKCVNVQVPTVVPSADFVADKSVVEQFSDVLTVFDLSDYGPYQWTWEVYDSTDVNDVKDIISGDVVPDPNNNGSDEFSQNPQFTFDRAGCYTIRLVARNGIGSSPAVVKTCYVTVIEPTAYILGFGTYGPNADNEVESPFGTIFDNGGKNLNYSNNQGLGSRSFLKITPCNAQKIELTMTQLKFAGVGDRLKVWDGKSSSDPNAVLLADWTQGMTTPRKVVATSGSMYILFVSDGSGVDSGYAGFYTAELGPSTLTPPSFTSNVLTGFNSAPTTFTNVSQNVVGVPTWEWSIDDAAAATTKDFNYIFYNDGTYKVCLEVKSCIGKSKTCQNFSVITPNTQTELDITASTRRPTLNTEIVELNAVTNSSNRFEWTIFPTTYTLTNPPSSPSVSGTGFIKYRSNPNNKIPTPMVRFTAPGCYTITLKAWNSIDSTNTVKTVVKNKFICAVSYCLPGAYVASQDLSINKVVLADGTNELINNYTTEINSYLNFSKSEVADLTYGKTYNLELTRNSTIDAGNLKGWIDWNIDGDFDDAGEEILVAASSTNKTFNTTFTVPSLSNSFEGTTRMRLAINYNNNTTTPCGPGVAGQYQDYGINLFRDNFKPVITLLGDETVRIEKGSTYTDAGATAMDGSEGDITPAIVTTNDLNVNNTGVYTYEYNVTDKSGNMAETKYRTVIVVNDLTAPVITLNSPTTTCIEADRNNAEYQDPGATAFNTNPFMNLNSAIRVTGSVNTKLVGDYTLTYSVRDLAGNSASIDRTVCVRDTKAPNIVNDGKINIQIGTFWVDNTFASDAYDDMPMLNKTWYPVPLNPSVKGTYTATYTAVDHEGNVSQPLVINYRVDDFIAPTINLNTFDVIQHDVNVPYTSTTATANDNYYTGSDVIVTKVSGNVNYNLLGTYQEVFRAVDGSGNTSTKTRTVKVVDRMAPTLYGGTIYGCVGETIWPFWQLTTKDNYYSPSDLMPLVKIIDQNVNPQKEGNYYVTFEVTDPSNNTSATLTRQVIYTYWPNCVNSTVDVDNVKSPESQIYIYPNPTQGQVELSFNGYVLNNATIEVINQLGQVVRTITVNEASSSISIDLSNLAQGVYNINVVSNNIVVTKKVTVY